MPTFYGTFEHALDEKNRLMIPSRLRDQVPASEGSAFFLTYNSLDGCLLAYTEKGWQESLARIEAARGAFESRSVRHFLRRRSGDTRREELDAQGRLLLPDDLKGKAGIRREVVLLGVMDHIELWDRKRWLALSRTKQKQKEYEQFVEKAGLFG